MGLGRNIINMLFGNNNPKTNTNQANKPKNGWNKVPNVFFKASPDAREIIDEWLKENKIPANTFGKVLYKIGLLSTTTNYDSLFGDTTIPFEKVVVPIDDPMRTDGFIGCLNFNTNGSPIHSSNKNSKLLNFLIESSDFSNWKEIHYYVYLYKDAIKVVTKISTYEHIGEITYAGELKKSVISHNLLNEYSIFVDTNGEIQITELFDKYHVERYYYLDQFKMGKYKRIRTNDKIQIEYTFTFFSNEMINYRIEWPYYINFDVLAENKLMKSLVYCDYRVDSFLGTDDLIRSSILDIFNKATSLVVLKNNSLSFKVYCNVPYSNDKEEWSYTKTSDYTLINISKSTDNNITNYSCIIKNEIIDANSMQRTIELTDGKYKIVILVKGQNIDKITNEHELVFYMLKYILKERKYRENYDKLYSQIIKNSFQDPPSNYSLVKVSILENEEICFEKEWHAYRTVQQGKNAGQLVRQRKQ